jgi:hypothetical protein
VILPLKVFNNPQGLKLGTGVFDIELVTDGKGLLDPERLPEEVIEIVGERDTLGVILGVTLMDDETEVEGVTDASGVHE